VFTADFIIVVMQFYMVLKFY